MKNPWTTLTTKPIYDNPWIKVVEHDVLNPKGRPGIYGVVRYKNLAIGVIPIHADGTTVLVGQYRYPLEVYSWEIPEGGGNPAVEPVESAKRELVEETGLAAGKWLRFMELHLSNSVSDEHAINFLAWDLTEGLARPDDTEQLAIRRVPFAEAVRMAMEGEITDAMAVAGLLKAQLMLERGMLPAELAEAMRR
ncbi:MAG: NUDIX hydrolase [Alphaproteobacteria bacterium]|nr:NUDIX hydrolase [Alphaproteobacteria bacterium]